MEDDEFPSTFGIFSRRHQFNPLTAVEERKAAEALVEKIQKESSKETTMSQAKKSRKKEKKNQDEISEVNGNAWQEKRNFRNRSSKSPKDSKKDEDDTFSEVVLSSASRRKLQKLRTEEERELHRIEAANQRLLSALDHNSGVIEINDVDEEFEKIIVLSISHMSKMSRLKCYENDKFVDIFPKVADLFNLKVTEFLLCLKERNITTEDTPKSLEITDQDVLECIPYKGAENWLKESEDNPNVFKILFQSNDTKEKIDMSVHKMDKMQDIMRRYSELRNIPLEQLIFNFDGDRISGEETPAELDMESESCIDVTVVSSSEDLKRGEEKENEVISVDLETGSDIHVIDLQQPMLDVIVIPDTPSPLNIGRINSQITAGGSGIVVMPDTPAPLNIGMINSQITAGGSGIVIVPFQRTPRRGRGRGKGRKRR